jgi:LCP family protein required for cell wall assembly
MKNKLLVLILLTMLLSIIVSCGGPLGNPESAVKVAFENWAQNYGSPYKDVQYNTLNNDGTYATVSVIGYFRESSDSDWIQMQTYVEVKNVGDSWHCNDNQFFFLTPKTNTESLIEACSLGYIEEVKKFLKQGIDVNLKDYEGRTALVCAILNNHIDIANLLIDRGADVNTKDIYGITVLWHSLLSGNYDIANLLIDKGADVNAKDNNGRTLLMNAVEKNEPEIVSFLIDRGADINAKDNDGYTVLYLANNWGLDELVNLLKGKGAYGILGPLELDQDINLVFACSDDNFVDPDINSIIFSSYYSSSNELRSLCLPTKTLMDVPAIGQITLSKSVEYGGIDLLSLTLENTIGVDVDNYVLIDVVNIVNNLGGLELDLDEEFTIKDYKSNNTIRLNQGQNIMDGSEAINFLKYFSGIEKDVPIENIKMQKMFLDSLIKKIIGQDDEEFAVNINSIDNFIETSLSREEMIKLFSTIAALSNASNKIYVLNVSSTENEIGETIYLPDVEELTEIFSIETSTE